MGGLEGPGDPNISARGSLEGGGFGVLVWVWGGPSY